MQIFSSLSPIFIIMVVGLCLRRSGFIHQAMVRDTNKLCFWIGLPCLLFLKVAEAQWQPEQVKMTFLVMCLGVVFAIALGVLLSRLMSVPRDRAASLVQAGFRGNLAYVGLPVVIYVSGDNSQFVSLTVLTLACTVPIYNIAAVMVLLGHQPLKSTKVSQFLVPIITNPLVLACAAGIIWSLTGLKLPTFTYRTLDALGQMALPLALLGIGANLRWEEIGVRAKAVVTAGFIKCIATPCFGWLMCYLLGMDSVETTVVLVLLSTPTAAASFVMAEQMGADLSTAAGSVALSTLLSFLSLWTVLTLSMP